jgi:predicted nucleotidyltransferase component of viral defense system
MLNIQEIKLYYPEFLRKFDRFIYREYLQYKILEIIFDSPFANKMSFIGGTCLRIVHNNNRFSEDIDFDNFNLPDDEFKKLSEIIENRLSLLGYNVEMRNVSKGAYHCYIRFPELLFRENLSSHREEKILIQIDSETQKFDYQPQKHILNKFDVFTKINTAPKEILLSQKFFAVLNRKRNKGRDFFDIVFLLGMGVEPDFAYLSNKTGINNSQELKKAVIDKCAKLNMSKMAEDVKPFLFNGNDVKKILLFEEYISRIM